MIKLITTLLCLNMMAYAGSTSSTYNISSIRVEKKKVVVSFAESAPYYSAGIKLNDCFQRALKSKSRVQVKYDYNSFEIQSCKVIK